MIYVDTHIVVWLYAGRIDKLSDHAKESLNENEIRASPVTRLELQYLNEINRVTVGADEIIADLSNRIGLRICDKSFNAIISHSMNLGWARDPFDRVIVANAAVNNDALVTKDRTILENYKKALC